jgi:hypothetical protein
MVTQSLRLRLQDLIGEMRSLKICLSKLQTIYIYQLKIFRQSLTVIFCKY